MPVTYATNGNRSPQFRVPGASFPKVPETTIYNTPAISIHDVHPAHADPHSRAQVQYYANWLAKQAKHDVLNDNTKEINDYIQEATRVVKVGEKVETSIAHFRTKLSALHP